MNERTLTIELDWATAHDLLEAIENSSLDLTGVEQEIIDFLYDWKEDEHTN